jgi:hypothetical protein
VNDDNGFGVPAGWYPDPLGLPQMRWWDNHGWTEHTTEARAPIVIQEAKLAWADDDQEELPTRRERRERERIDSVDHDDIDPEDPAAESLLQLEPPSWDEIPADEPAPEVILTPHFESAPAESPAPAATATATAGFEGFVQQATPTATTTIPTVAETIEQPATAKTASTPAGSAPNTNTAGAWVIAMMPLAQLVATLLVVSAAGAGGTNVNVIIAILVIPYFLSFPFAVADRNALLRNGYENPVSWAWAILTGPVYLIARAIRILMRAGNGFGPILVWCALVLLQLGSLVAVPGLVIAALPQTFSQEAAQSIQHDATVFGPITSVSCPAPPATQMGQEFTCTLYRVGSGQSYKVKASLQRENGWIAWRVDDWGNYNRSS